MPISRSRYRISPTRVQPLIEQRLHILVARSRLVYNESPPGAATGDQKPYATIVVVPDFPQHMEV